MSEMGRNGQVIVSEFVAAVNDQDWTALERLVAPDFVRHSVAGGEPAVGSRSQLIEFLGGEYLAFPDARETILDILEDGDRVAVRMRFEGRQSGPLAAYPPTGKEVKSTYLAIYRIQDERIVEAWAEWDNLSTLRSLGHL